MRASLAFSETVILETTKGESTKILSGESAAIEKLYTPASTFKIILAWAGLEKGIVSPETKHQCSDSYVPGTPREISFKEAMFYSSNDYFVWLVEQLGSERLNHFVKKSSFFSDGLPENWPGKNPRAVVRGGELKVSPHQQHQFIQRVMRGELASSPKIQDQLLTCLEWPTSDSKVHLYGKTGSYGGVTWFNGFGRNEKGLKAVTILLTGKEANRDRAIALFYKQWGLTLPKAKS